MSTSRPDTRFLFRHPAHWIALGFGSGLAPVAPGTFGTLAGIPLYFWWLAPLPVAWQYGLMAIAFVLGISVCAIAGRALGEVDHGSIVWDEIVAIWLVLAMVPHDWPGVLLGFIFFRLFDITKPFPVGWLDKRMHNPLGVMLDDVLAAAYAILVIRLLYWAHG